MINCAAIGRPLINRRNLRCLVQQNRLLQPEKDGKISAEKNNWEKGRAAPGYPISTGVTVAMGAAVGAAFDAKVGSIAIGRALRVAVDIAVGLQLRRK